VFANFKAGVSLLCAWTHGVDIAEHPYAEHRLTVVVLIEALLLVSVGLSERRSQVY